ncbi:MAG: polysaccharide biosynthesis/export family protein [Pseudomonadota bacterium]
MQQSAPLSQRLKLAMLSIALLALAACDTHFPVTERGQANVEEDNVTIVALTPATINAFNALPAPNGFSGAPTPEDVEYRVGTGDVISVIVWDHPELTIPAGPERSAVDSGAIVRSDGTMFFPYVGSINAAGRTTGEIRSDLSRQLSRFIPSPQVEVRIVRFGSQRITVAGAVETPGSIVLQDLPLALVDAIRQSGGLTEQANPREITLQRGAQRFDINYDRFLEEGDTLQNPILRDGDIVRIPQIQSQNAYLLGQVRQPGLIPLGQDPVTLTQAVTQQGGINENEADTRGVFIFRSEGSETVVAQLDVSSPIAYLLGNQFILRDQDVVYVTTAPIDRWNAVIADLLPSFTAERALRTTINSF